MPTRNVVLTDYQADLVERLVASGRYQNASEVLREGLRLIESRVITYTAPYTATYTEWPGKDLQRLVRA
jgi:Arc/MetJ-type ribon-helix-helix transcriptional regulator